MDDDFIDDGDLEMNEEDDDIFYNDADTSKFAPSELPVNTENKNSQSEEDEVEGTYDADKEA